MTSLLRFLAAPFIAAALLASLFASPAALAQSFNPEQRGEIEAIIRDYFIKHPEMIEELQQLAQAEKIKRAISEHKEVLLNSPRQVTIGNPTAGGNRRADAANWLRTTGCVSRRARSARFLASDPDTLLSSPRKRTAQRRR